MGREKVAHAGGRGLTELGNFTPVPDDIVREYGLLVAAVWGRMWRYAQQDDNVCRAGEQRIADDLDLGRMTVRRAKLKLMKSGYLEDITPDVRNKPHRYKVIRCTRVVHPDELGVPERDTDCTTAVQQNGESSTTVVHEDTIEETKKRVIPSGDEKPPPKSNEQYPMMCTIGEVCKMDLKLNNGQIGKVAKGLLAAGYTKDQVQRAYSGESCWWRKQDWRGQKGQPPKPADIPKTIMQAVGVKHAGPTSSGGQIPSS